MKNPGKHTYQSHCNIIDFAHSSAYLAIIKLRNVFNSTSRAHARQRLILRDHLTAPRVASTNKTFTTLVYRFMNELYGSRIISLRRIYQAAFFIARFIRSAAPATLQRHAIFMHSGFHDICVASSSSLRRGDSVYNVPPYCRLYAGVLSLMRSV